ncbi:hypothetical protein AB0F93_03505 [Micromonospora tulbaghiae]|uniref:hypothetical protein n=1 Tax=Micromonospora tulbaghiae TaxID=479978 RepID=UPI0033255C84
MTAVDDLVRALAAVYGPADLELLLPYLNARAASANSTARRDVVDVVTRLGDHVATAYALTDRATDPAAGRPVRPVELNDLGARARRLADAVDAVNTRLAAADESTTRAGFRLDDAAATLLRVAGELEATATDLFRVVNRSSCPADWGVCPEHGGTLVSTGGRSWCPHHGCGRKWPYDRLGLPCQEPAAFDVRGADGNGGPMCAGHAVYARAHLPGATVTALPAQDPKEA